MKHLFIFFLFLTFQSHSQFNCIEKLKHDIKKIQESITSPFNKKIEREEKKLNNISTKIQEKNSFKKLKNLIEELKATDLYRQKIILQESLKVIKDLLNYTITMESTQLLDSVSRLIENPRLTSDLKPFLYKQRARLMDNLDEGLFSASLAKQIHILQKTLIQELEFCTTLLKTNPLYKELTILHTAYLTEKEPKQALASIEKIMSLEYDKAAILYKNKELRTLNNKLNFYVSRSLEKNQLSLYNEPVIIKLLINNQYKLLLGPLDILIL